MSASVSESVRSANAGLLRSLPFDDTADFEDAQRGLIGRLDPCVVRAADGRVVWDNESYGSWTGRARDGQPEPVAAVAAGGHGRPVRGGARHLPGPRLRPVEHHLRRGRHRRPRHRPARSARRRPRRRWRCTASTAATGRSSRSSTPTATWTTSAASRASRPRRTWTPAAAGHRAGGVPGARHRRERLRRARPWRAGQATCTARCSTRARRPGRRRAGPDDVGRHGDADRADRRHHGHRRGARRRRRPDGVPAHAGHRSAGRDELPVPRPPRLCMAENATHTLHNILTLRGAVVRDPRVWARYITEAIDRFGERTDVVFASHHWPTWGRERAVGYLATQRDLYAYLHDQTLRMLNRGMVGTEIAEAIELPPALEARLARARLLRLGEPQRQGHLPALHGLVRRQPGAPLAAHRRSRPARRYVAAMGGADAVLRTAPRGIRRGRLPLGRGAAQPRHLRRARQRGRRRRSRRTRSSSSASGPRTAPGARPTWPGPPSCGMATSARRRRPPPRTSSGRSRRSRCSTPSRSGWTARAPGTWTLSIGVELTDDGRAAIGWTCATACWSTTRRRSMAPRSSSARPAQACRGCSPDSTDGITLEGDATVLARLMAVLEAPDPDFAIVTP